MSKTIRELEESSRQLSFYDVRHQLTRFVYARSEEAFAAGDRARDAVSTIEQLRTRQETMRSAMIESLGHLPPDNTPLNPQVTGTVECEGFTIEKIIFQSRPDVYVTANLYLPADVTSPRGAVLFLCGHHEQAKHEPEYQRVCQYLVHADLIVLAQDPVGQGERFSYHEPLLGGQTVTWGTTEHDYAGSQCLPLGYCLGRFFLHDAMRGLDYLLGRPEVDADRVGVTGNSGGGTQSSLMMVCDPRLAAAAPTTFVMNRRSYMYAGGAQDAEQIWPGMTALGFDHEDILLGMAPRAARVLACLYDFFPIEGTRRTVERCGRLWELCGRGEDLSLVEDTSTHRFTPILARATAEFFSQHLLGRKVCPPDDLIKPLEPARLWCTQSGQVRGEINGARFVFEEIQDRSAELKKRRDDQSAESRKNKALTWLRERVLHGRRPCDLNPRIYATENMEDLVVEMCLWWSQEGVFNHAFLFRGVAFSGRDLPVTLAVWDGGTNCLQPHTARIRETCAAGRAVMVLDTSGVGAVEPASAGPQHPREWYGVIHKLNDDLLWLDDSLAAMRIYDVIRALDMIEIWPGLSAEETRVYAHGRQGVYAQLAAALDDRIGSVVVEAGMESYAAWVGQRHYDCTDIRSVALPGVLEHFDLPDLAEWRGDT